MPGPKHDLLFSFVEVGEELQAFGTLAESFLEVDSIRVIDQFREVLRSLEDAEPNRMRAWEIGRDQPVITRPSKSYVGKGGQKSVWAAISTIWEIAPVGERSKKKRGRNFALQGKASTRVELFTGDRHESPAELGMWRMEIGTNNHPGVFFHTQVLGGSDDAPFPRWLDVPRFPGFIATPPQVMEFVISELFQQKWISGIAGLQSLNTWSRIQRSRFERLIDWQREELKRGSGSPWTALKTAKPPRELLTR